MQIFFNKKNMQIFSLHLFSIFATCGLLFSFFSYSTPVFASIEKYKAQKKLSQFFLSKTKITNDDDDLNLNQAFNFMDSIEVETVRFINDMVAKLRYSSYKLGGNKFDTKRGIYVLDCSTYVDQILKTIYPLSYLRLVNWSRSERPTTYDYYRFFKNLGAASDRYWHLIENVSQLRPGDILVFRKKNRGPNVSGHIMVVMGKPVKDKNVLKVRITDSAPFRHSKDTRARNVSGIGIGTFLLKFNPKTYKPLAYAWQANSPWKYNVKFAMARPNIRG